MTMYDKQLEFANGAAAAMTAGSTALVLTNVIDTTDSALTLGQPIYFVCIVTTAIVAAGAGLLEVQLVSDGTSSIATDTSVTYHIRVPNIVTANNSTSNPAGKVLVAQALPQSAASTSGLGNAERYLGARLLATTQNISSGNVTCFLTQDPGKFKAYANAV